MLFSEMYLHTTARPKVEPIKESIDILAVLFWKDCRLAAGTRHYIREHTWRIYVRDYGMYIYTGITCSIRKDITMRTTCNVWLTCENAHPLWYTVCLWEYEWYLHLLDVDDFLHLLFTLTIDPAPPCPPNIPPTVIQGFGADTHGSTMSSWRVALLLVRSTSSRAKRLTQQPAHPPVTTHRLAPTRPPCKVCSLTRIA